jgi:hypothetical protein
MLRQGTNGCYFAEIIGRAVHFPIPDDKLTHLTPQSYMSYESFLGYPCFPPFGQVYPLIASGLPPKASRKGHLAPHMQEIAVHD